VAREMIYGMPQTEANL